MSRQPQCEIGLHAVLYVSFRTQTVPKNATHIVVPVINVRKIKKNEIKMIGNNTAENALEMDTNEETLS